jgi:hypothetical protein
MASPSSPPSDDDCGCAVTPATVQTLLLQGGGSTSEPDSDSDSDTIDRRILRERGLDQRPRTDNHDKLRTTLLRVAANPEHWRDHLNDLRTYGQPWIDKETKELLPSFQQPSQWTLMHAITLLTHMQDAHQHSHQENER